MHKISRDFDDGYRFEVAKKITEPDFVLFKF